MQANQRVLQQKLHKKLQVCEFAESTFSIFYGKISGNWYLFGQGILLSENSQNVLKSDRCLWEV